MARLEQMPEQMRTHILKTELPRFDTVPWTTGPSLAQRRVAIVSTAGLHRRDDRPFTFEAGDNYRIIPSDISADDLVMSHVSTNFDRSGFQQDWNVVFPLDRLRELAAGGDIGSVAAFHYSFMGAVDPKEMEDSARKLAALLKRTASTPCYWSRFDRCACAQLAGWPIFLKKKGLPPPRSA